MPTDPKAIFALPGTLTLEGRAHVIPAPTPGDVARVHDRMREIALTAVVSPLEYVSACRDRLDPASHAEAIRAAVAMGSGGGVEPTRESVYRAYDTLAGVRWRVWYAVRKGDPGFTQEAVEKLVTEDNRFEVADALARALGLDAVEKKAPESGERP